MAVLLNSHVMQRTLRLQTHRGAATGLMLTYQGRDLLLTAAHLVDGVAQGETLQYRRNNSWLPVNVQSLTRHPRADVAVLALSEAVIDGVQWDEIVHSHHAPYGCDIAFCGYPLGLEISDFPENDGWPYPLIKSGILSGRLDRAEGRVLVFDAMNNSGFSGGPVFRRLGLGDGQLSLLAIVSGYLFDGKAAVQNVDESGRERQSPTHYVRPNSGFMYGPPTHFLRETLELAAST